MSKFKNRNIFTYLFLYKITIELIYFFCISPIYSYSGLTNNINYTSYWLSNLYLLLVCILSPKNKFRPSSYLYIILEVFLLVPLLVYYWMNNQSAIYTFYVIICLMLVSIVLKNKPININLKIQNADLYVKLIFIIYILITIYLIIKRGGIDLRTLNFDLVYDLRSESQISGVLGYLMNWSTKVFCPFFVGFFYYKKNYLMIILTLFLQLMMYLSFGFKAFLFSIGIIIISTYITKKKKFETRFILAILLLNIVSYSLDFFKITDSLRRAIPYRMIFIPAQIQFQYYEFFKNIEKLHFADNFIGKILSIKSPFSENIAFVISRYFSYNDVSSNSNTGIFSDAYANGGFINMLIFAMILAITLLIIDSTTNKLPVYVVVGAFSYLMFVLNDTPLLTTLLTGGVLLMILLLYIFNSAVESEKVDKT